MASTKGAGELKEVKATKRLIVFHYPQYYPGGGLGDCILMDEADDYRPKVFGSIEEIKKYKPRFGWSGTVEVLDLDTLGDLDITDLVK